MSVTSEQAAFLIVVSSKKKLLNSNVDCIWDLEYFLSLNSNLIVVTIISNMYWPFLERVIQCNIRCNASTNLLKIRELWHILVGYAMQEKLHKTKQLSTNQPTIQHGQTLSIVISSLSLRWMPCGTFLTVYCGKLEIPDDFTRLSSGLPESSLKELKNVSVYQLCKIRERRQTRFSVLMVFWKAPGNLCQLWRFLHGSMESVGGCIIFLLQSDAVDLVN